MTTNNEILYHCTIHGELTAEMVVKKGVRHQKQDYRCKACYKELKARHYQKHKEKILAKHKARREQFPELVKEQKARSFQKNKHKYYDKRRGFADKPIRTTIAQLFDQYVIDQLNNSPEFMNSNRPEQLLQLKRIMHRMKSLSYRKRHENKLKKENKEE